MAGRPTDYTDELIDLICSRLAEGESMRSITRDPSMPAMTTMFRWLREKESFRQQYAMAKEEAAETYADEIVEIADNEVGNPMLDSEGMPMLDDHGRVMMVKDGPAVNHARLRVDARKWVAAKLKPKKYGDRIAQEVSGPNGGPVETRTVFEFTAVGTDYGEQGKD